MCEFVRENEEGKNEWVVAAWMGHNVDLKTGKENTFKLPKPILKKMASERLLGKQLRKYCEQ